MREKEESYLGEINWRILDAVLSWPDVVQAAAAYVRIA
jgi:hypothetical protein